MSDYFRPGDVVAMIVPESGVELVRVAKCNSRRVVSYMTPGRERPIAWPDEAEAVTIGRYQAGASALYDLDERSFADEDAARAGIIKAEVADL